MFTLTESLNTESPSLLIFSFFSVEVSVVHISNGCLTAVEERDVTSETHLNIIVFSNIVCARKQLISQIFSDNLSSA